MKSKYLLYSLFLCSFAICICSCSDDSGPPYSSLPEGTVSLEHDGEYWESTSVSGISVAGINNYIALNGTSSQLSLTVENNDGGQYMIGDQSLSSITFSINSTGESYSSFEKTTASGEINIAESNFTLQTISGTFNAVVVDGDGNTKVIAEGLFHKIRYN